MAKFQSAVGHHFSDNGTNPWAHFQRVPGSDPVVYEFETDDASAIDRLAAVDGVTRVDEPKSGRKAQTGNAASE